MTLLIQFMQRYWLSILTIGYVVASLGYMAHLKQTVKTCQLQAAATNEMLQFQNEAVKANAKAQEQTNQLIHKAHIKAVAYYESNIKAPGAPAATIPANCEGAMAWAVDAAKAL